MLYDNYMPKRIEGFLNGYNCNIMAYGQTGTGKTHTMFGPPGYMARQVANLGENGKLTPFFIHVIVNNPFWQHLEHLLTS